MLFAIAFSSGLEVHEHGSLELEICSWSGDAVGVARSFLGFSKDFLWVCHGLLWILAFLWETAEALGDGVGFWRIL